MARTSTKRKSESALPTGRSKYRRTSAQKDDASDSAGDESSDHLFVDQEPVAPKHIKKSYMKSRKSEPVKRTTRSDEYEEDEGRMESQQFLAIVQFKSKEKKESAKAATEYMDKFEGKIDDAEESLKKRLKDLSIEASKQDSDFTETFQDAYAASRPLPPAANGESQVEGQSKDISFVTLFDRSQEIIEGAKLIVEKFENACQKTSKVKTSRLMDNNWGAENVQTAEILATGHQVGLDKYDAMLMGSSAPDIEEDSVVADLIYPDTEGHKSIPWGGIAKKGEKTIRKLLKVIVMEAI